MKADFLYTNAFGRTILKVIQKTHAFKLAAFFLRTGMSKFMIAPYIKNNDIDMTDFEGRKYHSFADFFARKKDFFDYDTSKNVLISPCDSLLSIYPITTDMSINMKGSRYRLQDFIPDDATARLFTDGLCMIFRLEASDYHHFCSIDDLKQHDIHFIKGQLHSVQPIACKHEPVYKLNRRWWSLLDTEHFGTIAQVEVGAMLVGGVTHRGENKFLRKGEEMGNFELAGSTIALFFNAQTAENLKLYPRFEPAMGGKTEVRLNIGEGIGEIE